MLTIGSLFSGIGGLELGLERAGLGPVRWQCEIDPFCRSVLARHWPGATRYDDVSKLSKCPPVDLICGGFPCQDVSAQGQQAGLSGKRSGLWAQFRRIVEETGPRYVIIENVASGAKLWLPKVRQDLHLLGYRTRALGIAASDCGAPHQRKRVFVLADSESIQLLGEPPPRPHGSGHSRAGSLPRSKAVLDPRRTSRSPSAPPQWASEPKVGRVVDGVPGRMDRLRTLGNAVVPQCAEVVGRVLREAVNR